MDWDMITRYLTLPGHKGTPVHILVDQLPKEGITGTFCGQEQLCGIMTGDAVKLKIRI